MFKFQDDRSYTMPAHFGPMEIEPHSTGWYHDVTSLVVSYLTDADKAAAYLPEPFELDEEPVLTVAAVMNRDVDWLAGHGYNLLAVSLPARYKSDDGEINAPYCLVMWENLTDPILSGRELLGVPKVYADIPDLTFIGGAWRGTAGHFGHKIVDLEVKAPAALSQEELDELAGFSDANLFGWKYFPKTGDNGAAVSTPTLFPTQNIVREAWIGQGEISWRHLTWEQNPTQYRIVNALADLPVLEHRLGLVTKGSTNLFIPERLPRDLK